MKGRNVVIAGDILCVFMCVCLCGSGSGVCMWGGFAYLAKAD